MNVYIGQNLVDCWDYVARAGAAGRSGRGAGDRREPAGPAAARGSGGTAFPVGRGDQRGRAAAARGRRARRVASGGAGRLVAAGGAGRGFPWGTGGSVAAAPPQVGVGPATRPVTTATSVRRGRGAGSGAGAARPFTPRGAVRGERRRVVGAVPGRGAERSGCLCPSRPESSGAAPSPCLRKLVRGSRRGSRGDTLRKRVRRFRLRAPRRCGRAAGQERAQSPVRQRRLSPESEVLHKGYTFGWIWRNHEDHTSEPCDCRGVSLPASPGLPAGKFQ
ncbi:spidroin-1-like [Columba livia]|uniref:spidroin-1-like n=1 Tax=Columba livia TaxID=8932 RepID=UPI0031BB538F